MKRSLSFITIVLIAVVSLAVFLNTAAMAADMLINTEVKSAVTRLDKNGAEYVRLIISEERKIQGITYDKDVVVMAFGSAVEKAKTLAAGDMLKAIVSSGEYKGRVNYSIIDILQQ